MVNIELFLVDLLISIKNGSGIDSVPLAEHRYLFDHQEEFYDLLNVIMTSYKTRFSKCYNNEQRNVVRGLLSKDLSIVTEILSTHNCDPDLLLEYFEFVVADRFYSDDFRTKARNLVDMITKSDDDAIRLLIATRIMSTVIRCRLYGSEGFDSILEECASMAHTILEQDPCIPKFSLME